MNMEIQNAINRRLGKDKYEERLKRFRETLESPGGRVESISKRLEYEKIKAENPAYVAGSQAEHIRLAIETAAHLNDFLRIMSDHGVKPDDTYDFVTKEEETVFGVFKVPKIYETIPVWVIQYDAPDGYYSSLRLAEDGRLVDSYHWVPATYSGTSYLVASLAEKMIEAGITDAK